MPSGSKAAWRVLVALLVHEGDDFVRPCLTSLARLQPGSHSVEVLVLDDSSTVPGWSDRWRDMTTRSGFGYYRTPRSLGTPRTMNLAMQRAVDEAYDAVILMSSDTIAPSNLITALLRPLIEDPSVSSTSAWSDGAGTYSIPTADPGHLETHLEIVDWISERCSEEFDGHSVSIPSGGGCCMAFPTAKLDEVGLMDPVFADGHWTEIDWCLRSHGMGYRSILVPSCFVHRADWETRIAKGNGGDLMDRTRRAVIEERYPSDAALRAEFSASSILADLRERGLNRIVVAAARENGFRLEIRRLHTRSDDMDSEIVRVRVDPDGAVPVITASWSGFEKSFTLGEGGVLATVEALVGQPPREIRIFDRGSVSRKIEAEVGASGAVPLSVSPSRL